MAVYFFHLQRKIDAIDRAMYLLKISGFRKVGKKKVNNSSLEIKLIFSYLEYA